MGQATYEDAQLVLRLYELRREEKMRTAREWIAASLSANSLEELNEQCPVGSVENAYFRMVTSYWEMAASFVTQGILNEGSYIKASGEGLFVWIKISPFVEELRTVFKNPMFLQNLEILAGKQIAFMEENAPGAYEAFKARVKS